MVENGEWLDSEKSFPVLELEAYEKALKADFAGLFCAKCTQFRNLLECTSDNIEKCIVIYSSDLNFFISRVVVQTLLPFCISSCENFDKTKTDCHQSNEPNARLRCFLGTDISTLKREQARFFCQRSAASARLLIKSCDLDQGEVFSGCQAYADMEVRGWRYCKRCFKEIAESCKGNMANLTEKAIILRGFVDFSDDTTYKVLEKEFFFKEKIND